jgi:uncharacterized RDD family membrane protein YckC
MNKKLRPSVIKRVLALFLDFIILGVIGFVLSLFLEDFFVSLGVYGSLFGTIIIIGYFGILNSQIGKGQSLGKRAIDAKVVDTSGNHLNLSTSLLRASILFFPLMNIELFSSGKIGTVIMVVLIMVIFATIYLILINKSRRTLHDILLNTVVVNSDIEEIEIDQNNDRSKKKIIPFGVIASIFIVFFSYQTFSNSGFGQLIDLKEVIENEPGVLTVNEVKSSTTTYYGDDSPTTFSSIVLTVRLSEEQEATNMNSAYFDRFYELVKQNISDADNFDGVTITLYWGYNIGIYRKTKSTTKTI